MRARLSHHLRLLLVALAAACAVAFNYRHVPVVRVVADAPVPGQTVVGGSHRVVVRERVSLESVHADAVSMVSPAIGAEPLPEPGRNPLGAWFQAKNKTLGALPTPAVRAVVARAAPAFTRLLGASIAPQAP